MSNAQKILDKIKGDQIQPNPRWTYTYKEWLKWIAYIVFIGIGSMAFSVILFSISVNGFDLVQHFKHSVWESFLVLLPILWLSTLVFFLGASVISVMQTGRAYKYTLGKWLSLSIGLSLTLGTLFFVTGGAKWLEHTFETNIESYESLLEKKTAIWSQPNLGTLSGEVQDSIGDTIILKDWKGAVWTIHIKNTHIAPSVDLSIGNLIKINGNALGDTIFHAEKIRPWGGSPGKCK
ncbi:MAG: hypothetical protein R2774_15420 [Saprospiraceae bacterium]